jgi:putative phosphoribosyl transferase
MGINSGYFGADTRFRDRTDAGKKLADQLRDKVAKWKGKGVVVGLPRGGMVVAKEVAVQLGLPLDFRAVRKIGYPGHEEFAIGAIDISGHAIKNPEVPSMDMPSQEVFDQINEKALARARQIDEELRAGRKNYITDADWCLIVDDGAATGLTVLAAVEGLKSEGKIVHVAVPVASTQAANLIIKAAKSFTAIITSSYFMAVSQFYGNFGEVSTEEAKKLLEMPDKRRDARFQISDAR